MIEPIHVVHFADLRLGVESYGKTDPDTGLSARALDYLARLDEVIAFVHNSGADLVVFAGDAFHSPRPNPTYQREFARRILSLSVSAPVLLLLGDRDLPASSVSASPIDIYEALNVPNIIVASDFSVERVSTARGHLVLAAAPFPSPATLSEREAGRAKSVAQSDADWTAALNTQLQRLAREADALADDATPRLLLGHFGVAGMVPGSERRFTLGRAIEADLKSLTRSAWDYVALGHAHRHQNLTADQSDAPPVVYAGSLERLDFGESDESKGFCSVRLVCGKINWRFVELAARERLALKIDCREAENPTRSVLDALARHSLDGAILRLEIMLTPESEARFKDREIQAALKRADIFYVDGFRKIVEREETTRLGQDAAALDELALLERYFESRNFSSERRTELLDKARKIMADG